MLAYEGNWLRPLELDSIDARFKLRGTREAPSQVVVVGVDAQTLRDLSARLPLPRSLHADLLRVLDRGRPELIAYDVVFLGKTREVEDRALISAVKDARPVLLATQDSPEGAIPVPANVQDPGRLGAVLGTAAIADEADGKARRMLYGQITTKTFAVKAAELVRGKEVSESSFRDGAAWIDFRGPPGSIPTYSFSEVLDGRVEPTRFRGKVVVIGVTDPVGKDLFITPTSERSMSGPELQANAIATALDGFPLRSAPPWTNVLLVVTMGLMPVAAAVRFGAAGTVIFGIVALVVLAVGLQLFFDRGEIVIATYPVLAVVLSIAGSLSTIAIADRWEHRRLRELFARFDPEVVRLVLSERGGDGASARMLDPSSIIAGYRIEALTGEGAMGVVYRATQLALDRPVAVKLIRPEHAHDPVYRERFATESRLAAAIEHPHVLPVYEAGEEDGLLFIAMRFVEGHDLGTLLQQGPLEPERLVRIVAQVGAALDAAHAKQLVHRDVKPENVLISADGLDHAYLTDFGVAKHTRSGDGRTGVGRWVGTLDYVAPEQLEGAVTTEQADIYSLGAVLYRGLTGEVPFPRDTELRTMWAHVNARPPRPSDCRSDIPIALDEVVSTAMAKDPTHRYATGREMGEAGRCALHS